MRPTIFHLAAAGTPVSWSITAAYKSCYGVAVTSARTWAEEGTPQFVCEIGGKDNRHLLLMEDRYLTRQTPDDGKWLVQPQTAPFELTDEMVAAVTDSLRSALRERGYLIPREEWRRRYPYDSMISARFSEFAAAQNAAGGMPDFDLRWAGIMEEPKGFVFPWNVETRTDGTPVLIETTDGVRNEHPVHGDRDGALSMARLLNSGWTMDEAKLMLRPAPLTDADLKELGR